MPACVRQRRNAVLRIGPGRACQARQQGQQCACGRAYLSGRSVRAEAQPGWCPHGDFPFLEEPGAGYSAPVRFA